MNRPYSSWIVAGCAVLGLCGCNREDASRTTVQKAPNNAYLATSEPTGAMDVGNARTSVEDRQAVVLVGRIGGSAKPFVDDIAAFTIVDTEVPPCAEAEGCPTPWDYCCTQDLVKTNIAMVKVVDAAGNPVAQDARRLLGVKELDLVVVKGTAQRDAEGNLAVKAGQVFVKQ
jgi:hypothetical protein